MSKILVIKHGALGDVVLATGPFAAIRKHHTHAHITLLTTKPYADMLQGSPYFDEIWIDSRPKPHNFFAFFGLMKKIQRAHFVRIYDLQTSERTSWYYRFLPGTKPEWVGTVKGSSHLHDVPEGVRLHTVERQRQQMGVAGIVDFPAPDVSWLTSDVSRFNLPEKYALIVPGGSSHRAGKRWPASHYAQLCTWLIEKGVTPVLIGTRTEAAVFSTIESISRDAVNLQGKTSFADVAELARRARFAIGNDTGPIHLIAVAGAPCIVLFSRSSDPILCAPRGGKVTILRRESLADLSPEEVMQEAGKWL